jgi:hypothetical protein
MPLRAFALTIDRNLMHGAEVADAQLGPAISFGRAYTDMRRCKVSMPVKVRNAFIGDRVGPKSRKATARALVVKAKSPKFS